MKKDDYRITEKQQKKLHDKIVLCKGLPESDDQKSKIRNEIYLELKPWLLRWMKSILERWDRYEESHELLSMSWDVFMFCTSYYKDTKYTIPKHFYEYTRYFLLNYYAKKESVFLPMSELKEILQLVESPENEVFEKLLALQQLKDALPSKYQVVFDDALQSLHQAPMFNKRTRGSLGFSDSTYRAIKEILKPVICILLDVPIQIDSSSATDQLQPRINIF